MDDQSSSGLSERSWRPFAFVLGFLAAFFAVVASLYFSRFRLSVATELALYLCLISLVALALTPGFKVSRALVEGRLPRRRRMPLLLVCWTVPYLIYAIGAVDFRWQALAKLLAISGLPLLVYLAAPVRTLTTLSWQDVVVWSWIVGMMMLRQWKGIWNVPVDLDFMARLFVIVVASWCWVFVRPVPDLGYGFAVTRRTVRAVALNFACFAVIALPLSFAIQFAEWRPRWRGLSAFCISYVEIVIFIAWLEELLFRGFLQSLLSTSFKSANVGQLVAATAFGFSHILLGAAPNWRYVLLASIAGWFYGAAFRQSGNLIGAALTHALVDAVWRTWFGGRG